MPTVQKPARTIRPYALVACTVVILLALVGATAKFYPVKHQSKTTTLSTQKTGQSTTPDKTTSPIADRITDTDSATSTDTPQQTPTTKPNTNTKPSSGGSGQVQPIPQPQQCTVGTATAPESIPADTNKPGAHITLDPIVYYTVYGYTADQIRSQLNKCTLVKVLGYGAYDAATTWYITYKFLPAYNSGSTTNCHVSSAAVTVHIRQFFPSWTSSQYDTPGLASQWQTYMANLAVHEQGHVDLTTQYSNQLYSGLMGIQDACNTISATATNFANGKLQAVQQANNQYDTDNGHGATQGAIFP